jgi:dTDP-4-dehydrorhamnose 3,5-epimerase
MLFRDVGVGGVRLIELQPHRDERGQFARAWCREEFARAGISVEMVQGNASVNPERGTLRGLHWQEAPNGEGKLVRCVRGSILDVAVDVDPASDTYLRWVAVELTPDGGRMLYVPPGCAHGFQTLVDDTEVDYLVSQPYAPQSARGLRYDDPVLGIAWPLPVTRISAQDGSWPLLEPRGDRPTVSAPAPPA